MMISTQPYEKQEFEYSSILAGYGLTWNLDGLYLVCRNDEQSEKNRVFISVVVSQVSKMLNLIIPLLIASNIGFAVTKNAESTKTILNGTYGAEHIGKVMILFLPISANNLIGSLSELLSAFSGPVVPRMIKLGNCLYGNPTAATKNTQQTKVQVLNGKYIVFIVLKSVPKGDVMRAIYLNRFMFPVWCIIKEAKYKMISDDAGLDMSDRLKWQQRIFKHLSSVVDMPKVIDFFYQDQNTYLVMQHINGITLRKAIDRTYAGKKWIDLPSYKRIYLLDILLRICKIVERTHDSGYVHRDLSTANFMISTRKKIFLLDWELAFDLQAQFPLPPFGFGTPGFTSPEQGKSAIPQIKEDIYGLTSLMIAVFTGLRPGELDLSDYHLLYLTVQEKTGETLIASFLKRGVSKSPKERPDIKEISAFVSHLYHNNLNPNYMENTPKLESTIVNIENSDKTSVGKYNYRALVLELTTYLYILLFVYTAFSKIITYNFFLKILSGLPMVGGYSQLLAISIVSAELISSILLIIPKARLFGLKLSLILMSIFTMYLSYHIWTGSSLPCSCGGVISQMNWQQHVLFNLGFIFLALFALIVNNKNLMLKISTRGNR